MAVVGNCPACERLIRNGVGCLGPVVEATVPDVELAQRLVAEGRLRKDEPMPRRRVRRQRTVRPAADPYQLGDHCPGCGSGIGQYHHFGCDLERCSACQEQLYLGCDCQADR
jgi:hypothetical protein